MVNERYQIRYLKSFDQDLRKTIDYIANNLGNPTAANRLLNDLEKAIRERAKCPEAFEPYQSKKRRKYRYYRIYVKNFVVYYIVIDSVMEVHRLIYNGRNRDRWI